jgi:hypothetical protein
LAYEGKMGLSNIIRSGNPFEPTDACPGWMVKICGSFDTKDTDLKIGLKIARG